MAISGYILNNTQFVANIFIRGPFNKSQVLLGSGQFARLTFIPGRKGLIAFDAVSSQLIALRPIRVSVPNQVFQVAGGSGVANTMTPTIYGTEIPDMDNPPPNADIEDHTFETPY